MPENSTKKTLPPLPTPAAPKLAKLEPAKPKPAEKRSQPAAKIPTPPPTQPQMIYAPARGLGCLGMIWRFVSCRTISCLILIIIVAFIALVAYTVSARPPAILTPAKSWLNGGLSAVAYNGTTLESAKSELNVQIADFELGTNRFTVTKDHLYPLLADKLKGLNLSNLNLELTPGTMKLYWNIDPGNAPLWVVIDFSTSAEGALQVDKVGFNKLPIPSFLNNTVSDSILATMKFASQTDKKYTFIDFLVPFPSNAQVTKIEIIKDALIVTVEVDNNLQNVL